MPHSRSRLRRASALLLGSAMILSACAVAPGMTDQEASMRDEIAVERFMPATREMRDNIETQELFAQAAFWSHEYELNPSDLEATIKLASAVRRLGNPGRAAEITQTSRAIHPRNPYLLAEHSAALIAEERALDAIPVIDDALRIAPAYGRLWSLKGAALDQMEEYDAARQHYQRALQITPNDPNVLSNLGLSYALAGDLTMAETWLRRATETPGAGAGVRQNLAMVLQLQGRTEDAERQTRLSRLTRGDRKLPPEPVPAFTPRQPSAGTASVPGQYAPRRANPARQMNSMAGPRLTTTAPDGRQFTSAADAARAAARQRQGNGSAAASPQPLYTGAPMTQEQAAILSQIQQSRQAGVAEMDGSMNAPHVVGPSLQTTQPYAYQQPPATAPVQSGGYPAPEAQTTRRTPARQRR
ncbi:tetratricopeptide repeat protein [Algimonas porphyrae]